jgi:hypothetical protein
VFLQLTCNAAEILEAKKQYETYARSNNVSISNYHADNGSFVENAWKDQIRLMSQTMAFSGVGAHQQNSISEKRIRDLQDLAKNALIHAIRKWLDAITRHLCPYALLRANAVKNPSMQGSNIQTPMELFSNSNVAPNLRHEHPFGCPVYVLIQGNMKALKWESRGRLGIYLGTSEFYAKTLGLVLSITAGLVSPQFHLKFDNDFLTVSQKMNSNVPQSEWQCKCSFIERTEVPSNRQFMDLSDVQLVDTGAINSQHPVTDILPITQVAKGAPSSSHEVMKDTTPTGENMPPTTDFITQPGCQSTQPLHLQDNVVYEALTTHTDQITPQTEYLHPLAFAASTYPDVLNYHEAIVEHDKDQFL